MAFSCKICGCSSFIFQNGYVVCEHCGLKYRAEDFSAASDAAVIQPMTSPAASEFENAIINGIREYNLGHTGAALPLFTGVLLKQPHNVDALFYKGLCEGLQSSLQDLHFYEMVEQACEAMRIIRRTAGTPTQFLEKCSFFLSECMELFHNLGNALIDCRTNYNTIMQEHRSARKRFLRGRLIEFGVGMALSTFLDVDTRPSLESSLSRDRENIAMEEYTASVAEQENVYLEVMETAPQQAIRCLMTLVQVVLELISGIEADVTEDCWDVLERSEGLFRLFAQFNQDPGTFEPTLRDLAAAKDAARQTHARLYWAEHTDEERRLKAERVLLNSRLAAVAAELRAGFASLEKLEQQKSAPEANEQALQELQQQLEAVNDQLASLNRYTQGSRYALIQQQNALLAQMEKLRSAAAWEWSDRDQRLDEQIGQVNSDIARMQADFSGIEQRLLEVDSRLADPDGRYMRKA